MAVVLFDCDLQKEQQSSSWNNLASSPQCTLPFNYLIESLICSCSTDQSSDSISFSPYCSTGAYYYVVIYQLSSVSHIASFPLLFKSGRAQITPTIRRKRQKTIF